MKKFRIIDWYIIALFAVSIAVITLRSYALFSFFNDATKYFDNKTAITVGNLLVIFSVIAFTSYILLGDKESDLIARTDNAATYIPTGLVCTAMIFMAVERFRFYATEQTGSARSLSLISGILALLSVVSFFVSIFLDKGHRSYKAAFSLCTVFFLIAYALFIYFNKNGHPINSQNKIVDQMAYLFSGAFFLYESRIHMGRAQWRPYISFGLCATLICLYSSVPSIILFLVNGTTVSDGMIESVLTLTLAIFIASRVIQWKTLTPNAECSAAKSISTLAAMREEEIEEQRKIARAHDNNNVEKEETEDSSNYTFDIPYITPDTDFNPDGADIDITGGQY